MGHAGALGELTALLRPPIIKVGFRGRRERKGGEGKGRKREGNGTGRSRKWSGGSRHSLAPDL